MLPPSSRIDTTFPVFCFIRKTLKVKPVPCDGIGAEVKGAVWHSILQSNAVVTSAEEFFETTQRVCRKISLVRL